MKKLLYIFFTIICCFAFLEIPQAASKWPNQCIYEGEYNGRAGFTKANVGNDRKVHFSRVEYYKESTNTDNILKSAVVSAVAAAIISLNPTAMISGAYGGAAAGAIANKILPLDLEKVETQTRLAANIINYDKKAKVSYFDGNSKQSMNLSQFKLDKDTKECPEYLVVLNNQYGNIKSYMTVALGDEKMKNYIEASINNAPNYNKVFYGHLIDISEFLDDKEETDYGETSCKGLLGNMVNGEYVEDTTGWLLQKVFDYMKLAAVVMVFAFSVVDYAKALIDQNQDAFKLANKKFGKRLIFGVVLFLLPILVNLILGVIDQNTCGIK